MMPVLMPARTWKSPQQRWTDTVAPAHPAPGCPPLVPIVPSLPPSPGPHLSQKKLSICGQRRGDGWLDGEASGHLRARARPAPGAGVKAKAGAGPWDGASAHPRLP